MTTIHDQFFMPKDIYLLSHSIGLLPKKTQTEANIFLDLWKTSGSDAWDEWLTVIKRYGIALATLLNGNVNEFCPQVNVSSALEKIVYSLPQRKSRKKIILSELDFPSMGFVLETFKKRGYELEFIPNTPCFKRLEAWANALKDDVQLAFITDVYSGDNSRNPVADITKITREKGIFSIVDIAQSVGILPIDVQKWNADFIIGSSLKWLCGGPGAGFLWVNLSEVNEFVPLDVGWFSQEIPFDLNIHHFHYAKTALRFLGGTPSVFPLYLASSGIETIVDIGVDTIHKHNQMLLDILLNTAEEYDLNVLSPKNPLYRGGTFVIKFLDPEKAIRQFKKHHIMVDSLHQFGMRFSPHIYNTKDEINAMTQVLKQLAST